MRRKFGQALALCVLAMITALTSALTSAALAQGPPPPRSAATARRPRRRDLCPGRRRGRGTILHRRATAWRRQEHLGVGVLGPLRRHNRELAGPQRPRHPGDADGKPAAADHQQQQRRRWRPRRVRVASARPAGHACLFHPPAGAGTRADRGQTRSSPAAVAALRQCRSPGFGGGVAAGHVQEWSPPLIDGLESTALGLAEGSELLLSAEIEPERIPPRTKLTYAGRQDFLGARSRSSACARARTPRRSPAARSSGPVPVTGAVSSTGSSGSSARPIGAKRRPCDCECRGKAGRRLGARLPMASGSSSRSPSPPSMPRGTKAARRWRRSDLGVVNPAAVGGGLEYGGSGGDAGANAGLEVAADAGGDRLAERRSDSKRSRSRPRRSARCQRCGSSTWPRSA